MLFRFSFLLEVTRADFRNSIMRYVTVLISFAVAIALLLSLSSFGTSIVRSMHEDSKSLLGADIVLSKNSPFSNTLFDTISDIEFSEEISFASMVQTESQKNSRLVQVRAQKGFFPYYGELQISPENNLSELLLQGSTCVVDESIIGQLKIQLGDKITLGSRTYVVKGIIKKYPGETYGKTIIAPKVIIPLSSLDQTNLLKKGSRVTHKVFIKHESSLPLLSRLTALKDIERFEIETSEDSRKKLGSVYEQVSKFTLLLSVLLVAVSALGLYLTVASFIKDKIPAMRTFFCLGATRGQILRYYLFICATLTYVAYGLGVIIAFGLVQILPQVFSDFLALSIHPVVELSALLKCFVVVTIITLLSVFFGLTPIRSLSPSQAIRDIDTEVSDFQSSSNSRRLRSLFHILAVFLGMFFSVFLFSSNVYFSSIVTTVSMLSLGVFFVVILFSRGIIIFLSERGLTFSLRYALSMLTRKSSTSAVLLSIGFTILILCIVSILRSSFIAQFSQSSSTMRPQMVLFDVQPDQATLVRSIVEPEYGTVLSESPIVTMRIEAINGVSNSQLRSDPSIPDWTLKREYRSTFRDHLIEGESLVDGTFISSIEYDGISVVPVTIDKGLASNLKVKIGDTIEFDVQGVRVMTKISGLRKINWRRIQTNFFFVFPKGVLESAPYVNAQMVSLRDMGRTAELQNVLIDRVPNVSAIDLKLVLDTSDEIIDRIILVIQFLGIFSLLSGVLILISSLYSTRLERMKETVLLRALGARPKDIFFTQIFEFSILTFLTIFPSFVLSLVINYFILTSYFDMEIYLDFVSLGIQFCILFFLILLVGLLFSRKILRYNVMHVLRE